MAKMIPAMLSENTKSDAERMLFPILRDGLDNSFSVFHSFNLLVQSNQSKFIEGEIDFLIFDHAKGFLVLEVKGGSIVYNGEQGIWYQNEKPLKVSPFEQAENSKHKLAGFLQKKLGYSPSCIQAHAVCFPDIFTELKGLPSGADPRICITGQQLAHIGNVIPEIISLYGDYRNRPISEDEMKRVCQILMPYCEYGTSLRDRMGQAEQVIFRLTENQCRLLDFISNHRQALIEGCAGSGKTIMAVKKARELALEGNNVLLLAYNMMIGDFLAASVSDLKNVTATNYHRFCIDRLKESGLLPVSTEGPDYWQEVPEAFAKLIEHQPVKYDAVIVDEGQDFLIDYWITISEMVKENGFFYIFYGFDQNINKVNLDFPINQKPFVLKDNCRNTRNIFKKLEQYSKRSMFLNSDMPEGEPVIENTIPDAGVRRRHLGKILHDLVNNKEIKRESIVILGGHSMEHTCIGNNPVIGNFYITEKMEDGSNFIHYHTYMKFKGCEADVVIIIDVDRNDKRWTNPEALYTTISRARHLLYILYCGDEKNTG